MNAHRALADWLAYIESQHPKAIEMGLERCREVARRMGLDMRSQQLAPRVVTVGGTNGKGSTVAFVEAIARAADWRVGVYTSPHLLRYNERVRIDGHDADDEMLIAAFEAVELARVGADGGSDEPTVALTYFEFGTLAALWLFAQRDLDLVVLEVGLGGRLDAVNLVDADVAVITTVDLDHQEWLGDTIEKIGFEKAGIARAWAPLILGDDDPPSSVLRYAYAIGASAVRIGCDFFIARDEASPEGTSHWRWRELGFELALPMPRLAAPVQLRNAAVAIAALRALPGSEDWDEAVYARGIAEARVAARWQCFERDGIAIRVDVCHNPQAARALAEALRAEPIAGRTHAVFAALGDKDIAGIVEALAGEIDIWWLAGLNDAGPRGTDVDTFAARLSGTAAALGARHTDVAHALLAAHSVASAGERILIFGSFFTAAAALRILNT
jgi:dihydrofolate synthase / folylpolyglutamate synthase